MAIAAPTVLDASKQIALAAADQADTVMYAPGRALVVNNGSAGPVTVAVPQYYDIDTTSDDVIATIPAGEIWAIPLKARYAGPDGTIDLTYSAIASVTAGILDFPRVGRRIMDSF